MVETFMYDSEHPGQTPYWSALDFLEKLSLKNQVGQTWFFACKNPV